MQNGIFLGMLCVTSPSLRSGASDLPITYPGIAHYSKSILHLRLPHRSPAKLTDLLIRCRVGFIPFFSKPRDLDPLDIIDTQKENKKQTDEKSRASYLKLHNSHSASWLIMRGS